MQEDRNFDVIVGGGSIAGLLAAREIASGGLNVVVLEEDAEIGTPEHCGGLVSLSGIHELGIIPSISVQQNKIKQARVSSPGASFTIDTSNQQVIVVDRRALDKQIAFQAQNFGAEIKVKCSIKSFSDSGKGNPVSVKTSEGDYKARYFVDARGVSSIIRRNRNGVLQSAQYEVYASWIDPETVIVDFDSIKYPGFFAWVIPTGTGRAKVGLAGKAINVAKTLNDYIEQKGTHSSIIRKIYAPIWINGPIDNFVTENVITVGDAAGQTKPTTAGGIYSCGMGGKLAGRAIVDSLNNDNDKLLSSYDKTWNNFFRNEFSKMLLTRKLFERLDNRALDELFLDLPRSLLKTISDNGSFDFHSIAITSLLGTTAAARIAKSILGNELRRLL